MSDRDTEGKVSSGTTKLSIKLERWGDSGWVWDMVYPVDDGVGHTRMRTDSHGDGLWYWERSGAWWTDGAPVMEWKQRVGTCQFHLPSSRRGAYQKIYNEWGSD